MGGWVLVYARTHTQTTWVFDVSPGVGRTPGELEESRSTKAQYTCRPYMCTKYICLYMLVCGFWWSGVTAFFLLMIVFIITLSEITPYTPRENGRNVTSFRGMAFVASDMGWLWTEWIGPAPVQMRGMLSGRCAVVIVCRLFQGLVVFSLTFCFFVNSHLNHSRAWISACSLTAALAAPLLSLQSFYNYARGHCEAAWSFFRAIHSGSVYRISVEQ